MIHKQHLQRNGAKVTSWALLFLACASVAHLARSSPTAAQLPAKRLTETSASKITKESEPQIGNRKRATSANRSAAAAATTTKEAMDAKKFQPRMMQAEPQASLQHQNQAGGYFMGSGDSWHPHTLLPTFTDQEQGDEMVALASDSEAAEQQKSAPSSKMMANNRERFEPKDLDSMSGLEKGSRGRQVVGAKQQRPTNDEYYPDEEEDDEELGKSMRDEYEPSSLATIREEPRDAHQKQQAKANQRNRDSNDDSIKRPVESQTAGWSTGKLNAALGDKSWLPSNQALESAAQTTQFAGNSQIPRENQRQQRLEPEAQKGLGDKRGPREKLVDLFGGRDSFGSPFSKTDAAIEYLRNLLRTKHENQVRNVTNASLKQQVPLNSAPERDAEKYETNVPSSAVDQIGANFSSAAAAKMVPTEAPVSTTASKFHPTIDLVLPSSQEKGSQSKASAKFSIGDAKPIQPQPQPQSQTQFSSTTTKRPKDEPQLVGGSGQMISMPTASNPAARPMPQMDSVAQPAADFPLINTPPNGTPLGGDYVESLDEYPRGSRQLNSRFNQMVGAESAPFVSMGQPAQDKLEQTAPNLSEQNSPPASEFVRYSQMPFKQQQVAERPNSNSFPESGQPIGLPLGISSSSRFYQQLKPFMGRLAAPAEAQNSPDLLLSATETAIKAKMPENVSSLPRQNPLELSQSRPLIDQANNEEATRDSQGNYTVPGTTKNSTEAPAKPQFATMTQGEPQKTVGQSPAGGIDVNMSKLYRGEHQTSASAAPLPPPQPPAQFRRPEPEMPKVKPPKIVSYNYFESPNESGEGELQATNYQLGDTLISSNGGVEQLLSGAELEAIQSQFMTADHPLVPLADQIYNNQPPMRHADRGSRLEHEPSFQFDPKSIGFHPESLQQLSSPLRQAEDSMRELASNEEPTKILPPPPAYRLQPDHQLHRLRQNQSPRMNPSKPIPSAEHSEAKKKKSLIVYLNHPRSSDMSKGQGEGLGLAQSIGDQPADPFVTAKEFDSHGLSKDSKHLDVSSLRGFGGDDIKESTQDKDGLSVVVIGDAYKYKKIVLLISSKSGGLKFIPMVKDMKK